MIRHSWMSDTVPRHLLLGCVALLLGGCGGLPETPDGVDATPLLRTQGAALGTTDRCAPSPAAQVASGDTVYHRYSSSKTWTAAKADCEAMGGRLAVPTSASNNELIRSINGGNLMHLGLRQNSGQSSTSAGWVTVEGDSPSYVNWSSGEPNDGDGHENGHQNCGRMWASGTWDDISCTGSSSHYVCEFGAQPVTCSGGATCAVATDSTYRCQCPEGQRYDAETNSCLGGPLALEVNSLDVDQAASGNVYVNFPLRARVGLKGNGSANSLVVSVGLMQKPSGPNAPPEELESLKSCMVGGTRVNIAGDGSQQYVDIEGIVPPECLGTDPQHAANFFVLLDGADEYTTEENKWLVFNEKEAQTPIGQRCTTTDPVTGMPRPGCVINVTIRPSPGLDISMLEAAPDSSVAVLAPPGQHEDVRPGGSEAARPLVIADLRVAAFGRDFDDPDSGTLPDTVDFTYDIIASPDNAQVGWKHLDANPEAIHAPIGTLKPGEALQLDARLHPTEEFRALTNPGGPWAGIQDFQVRACALVPFAEHGDPSVAGPNGTLNNCKQFAVHLVSGQFSLNSVSSYDVTKTYSKSFGSSSTIQLSLSGGSTNTFDLTGAYSDNDAKATISSFFGSFDMFDAWGDGSATVSPAEASVDAGFKVFGVTLLSYANSAGTVSYSKDISYSKSKCLTYSYGVVVASIDISGCFSASAGLDVGFTASATSISAQVRPYASATLSVSGTLNLTLYKATLSATLTVLGLNTNSSDGVNASLSFAIDSLSPLKLTIAFDTYTFFRVTTLDGSIDLTIEQLEANWCKKKVWGIKVYYVCWGYDTLAEYNLFSYDGYSYTTTLLDRSGSAITLQ